MSESAGDEDALPVGTTVGEYRIETLLGRGGMGEVYGASHPVIGKRVAIKIMNAHCSSNPLNVERFVHEAKAVNAIGHSNIVDIFSFGKMPEGRCYFVMEWLKGERLRTRLERGPVKTHKTLDILDQVLRALDAAHQAGIVHRDLKPDNIFVVAPKDSGETERIKLLDFGIAKLSSARQGPKSSMTQTGTVVGTPSHMSPEQASGGTIGPATDIYSLGVVAFELATGQLPFEAESSVQLMAKHIDDPPPKPSTIYPTAPGLEQLILAMLSKAPAMRPGASEIRERIAKLRSETSASEPTGERQIVPRAASDTSSATAPTVAVRKSEPALAVTIPTTSQPPVVRRRPVALVLGAIAVAATVVVYIVTRGHDHASAQPTPVPVATPAPSVAPEPVATPAPVATPPAPAVEAPTQEAAPAAVVEAPAAKPTPHLTTHRAATHHPAAEAGSAAVATTPPAPPAGSAAPTPAVHDVDAVQDPFASGGHK